MSIASFASVLLDATRLKPGHRLGFAKDVRWIFELRLEAWLVTVGAPALGKKPELIVGRNAVLFDEAPISYPTGVKAHPSEVLDAAFCLGYGFDDYSHRALNYAHIQRAAMTPAAYVQDRPPLFGNFAIALARKPVGKVPEIPDQAVRCVARAEWAYGKTGSVWAWLGVWIDRQKLDAHDVATIESFSDLPFRQWPPISSAYMTEFMKYYGHLGGHEDELRERLGFPEKGKPVAEKILLRSVHEAFRAEPVIHRYRGRELGGLELDIFLPERKLAFEYQGEQHTKHVAHWHGDDGLPAQQARDTKKRDLCKKLGYRVLYVLPGSDLRREGVVRMLRKARFLEPEFGNDEPPLCDVPPTPVGSKMPHPKDMSRADAIKLLQSWWNNGTT